MSEDTWEPRLRASWRVQASDSGLGSSLPRVALATPVRQLARWIRERPFLACGLSGTLAGSAVSILLAHAVGISVATQLAVVASGMLAFVLAVLATRALTGEETLTFYHDALAVLVAATAVTAALNGPILAHLDVTVIGFLVLLACGRVGCLLVGCCHGRPAKRGIVYGRRHAALGFPLYLVDRPLIPVPLFEIAAALAVSAVGLSAVNSERPGTALAFVAVVYGLIRIPLEELRGDWHRPYFAAISEAQWTSAVLILAAAVATWSGVLPPSLAAIAPVALVLEAAVLAYLRLRARLVVSAPGHLRELLVASRLATACPASQPHVITTSFGVRLSVGAIGTHNHVTFSSAKVLSPEDASELAGVLAELCLPPRRAELVSGVGGVSHLLTGTSGTSAAEPDRVRSTQPSPLLPRVSFR